MFRLLFKFIILVFLMAVVGTFLLGWWPGGGWFSRANAERSISRIDTSKAREVGAEIGSKASEAATVAASRVGGRQHHREDQSEDDARRHRAGAQHPRRLRQWRRDADGHRRQQRRAEACCRSGARDPRRQVGSGSVETGRALIRAVAGRSRAADPAPVAISACWRRSTDDDDVAIVAVASTPAFGRRARAASSIARICAVNFAVRVLHGRAGFQIFSCRQRRARLLQRALTVDERLLRRFQFRRPGVRARGRELRAWYRAAEARCRCACTRDFGFAACSRLAVGGLARRFLGPLAGVERARQRQAIVALRHGVVRLLQRVGRFGELRRGVLFGAGGARGVDGALGSIDFFLRGLGAAVRRGTGNTAGRQRGASGRKYSRDGVR